MMRFNGFSIFIKEALRYVVLSVFLLGLVGPAWAVDGQIVINQSKAQAGNVTPGDAAGSL